MPNSVTNSYPGPSVTKAVVVIASGNTNSDAFTFLSRTCRAQIGALSGTPTLTLQETPDQGITWVDTDLTKTTGSGWTSWSAEELAPYTAGGARHQGLYRLQLSTSDASDLTFNILGND
ncbi:MAG: hypothetical protein AAF215_27150 [Cyanobacteria bacterium P01_A01_bin.123]